MPNTCIYKVPYTWIYKVPFTCTYKVPYTCIYKVPYTCIYKVLYTCIYKVPHTCIFCFLWSYVSMYLIEGDLGQVQLMLVYIAQSFFLTWKSTSSVSVFIIEDVIRQYWTCLYHIPLHPPIEIYILNQLIVIREVLNRPKNGCNHVTKNGYINCF